MFAQPSRSGKHFRDVSGLNIFEPAAMLQQPEGGQSSLLKPLHTHAAQLWLKRLLRKPLPQPSLYSGTSIARKFEEIHRADGGSTAADCALTSEMTSPIKSLLHHAVALPRLSAF